MEAQHPDLAQKYNVAAPRYTSYPTMPYWDIEAFKVTDWQSTVTNSFNESNKTEGISVYIHLPFCESLCTYCGCNTRITKNHGVEKPYIEAVLKEWKMYLKIMGHRPIIRELHLGGGTPTFFSAENLKLLINGILENAQVHLNAAFSFEAHPGNTTHAHLQTLYNLGFRRLSLGIQDFDPKVQFIINRHQTVEQVTTVTEQARKIGYTSINYDLIYGLPLQTTEGLVNTMQIVAGLMPERIAFYSYAHVPWVKPGQRRFTDDDIPDSHTKNKLQEIGRSMLKSYGYREVGMDHFALPTDELFKAEREAKLHRNFMGYTDHHTQLLVGLGVSSISDSKYAFAQNVKSVEEYITLIEKNTLPAFKGHILTNDDLLIRQHILNIMCKGRTSWNHQTANAVFLFEGINRLQPMVEDGLIELDACGLTVTVKGKRFLRNICMAIDARLWANQPSSQLFSMAI
jgi:oxygen-independent coproporphyrinogen-3 oxidase